jgi:hypothetical protein
MTPVRSSIEISFPVASSGRLHLAAFSSQGAAPLILKVFNPIKGKE